MDKEYIPVIEQAMIDSEGIVDHNNSFYNDFVLPLSVWLIDNIRSEQPEESIYELARKNVIILLKIEVRSIHHGSEYYDPPKYLYDRWHPSVYLKDRLGAQHLMIHEYIEPDPVLENYHSYNQYTIASRYWEGKTDAIVSMISAGKDLPICHEIIEFYSTDGYFLLNIDCGIHQALYDLSKHIDSEYRLEVFKECVRYLNSMKDRVLTYTDSYDSISDIVLDAVNDGLEHKTQLRSIVLRVIREFGSDKQSGTGEMNL